MTPAPILAAAIAAVIGPPALAAAGDNVVVLRVAIVAIPRTLPGACAIRGVVEEVREGHGFRPGQRIAIRVPCARHGSGRLPPPARGRGQPVFDVEVLSRHRHSIARVDDEGRLIWRRSAHPYGRYGYVAGYRVLDAVFLPARPPR